MSDGLKLLRAICEQSSVSVLRETTEDLFVGDKEAAGYRYLRRHFRRYSEMPEPETIASEISKRLPSADENAQYYLDRCIDRRMFNSLRQPFNELREVLMGNEPARARELIAQMQRYSARYDTAQNLMTLGSLNQRMIEMYDDASAVRGISGITTGWDTLDDVTSGYQPGDLIFYVARPKVGKTNVLIHSVRTAWQAGHTVLLMSMEMTLERLSQRFHAQNAGLDPESLAKGRLSREAYRRYRNSLREVESDTRLHMYSGRRTAKSTGTVDDLIQEINPDIVFIDSFYLMQPIHAPRNTGRIEKVGYITNELKDIALERRRPIVSTTQFNRESGHKGRGGTQDTISFSDAILQDASLLISVKMPSWDSSERPRHRVLEVMEGREGERAKFAINFNFTPNDFSEADSGTQQLVRDTPEAGGPTRAPAADVDYMR